MFVRLSGYYTVILETKEIKYWILFYLMEAEV